MTETVLQFGSGRFLRGFADLFIHHANQTERDVGGIVVVQSTVNSRGDWLNAQNGRYNVLVQGIENWRNVDRVEESASIQRALVAQTDWEEVMKVAASSDIKVILSNTTEAGFALDASDTLQSSPPQAFPAKLLAVLHTRFEARQPGVTILPCELIEDNADRLRDILVGLSETWGLSTEFITWLTKECRWRNSLVDRIVVDANPAHPLAENDKLLISAEPFALWVIEQEEEEDRWLEHPALVYTPDVTPYFLRKVRILNGAHTAMAPRALAKGYETVKEAMMDSEIRKWLEGLLFEEIVPTMEGRVDEPEDFAYSVLERFANPFLEHKITNILLYHEQKQQTRLAPTREEFIARFGTVPRRLSDALDLSS